VPSPETFSCFSLPGFKNIGFPANFSGGIAAAKPDTEKFA